MQDGTCICLVHEGKKTITDDGSLELHSASHSTSCGGPVVGFDKSCIPYWPSPTTSQPPSVEYYGFQVNLTECGPSESFVIVPLGLTARYWRPKSNYTCNAP